MARSSQIWLGHERQRFYEEHNSDRNAARLIRSFSILPFVTYTDALLEERADGDTDRRRWLFEERAKLQAALADGSKEYRLLTPISALRHYALGTVSFHTMSELPSAEKRRDHFLHAAWMVDSGLMNIRLYGAEESLFFTICDEQALHVTVQHNLGDAIWAVSTREQGLVLEFIDRYDLMWDSAARDCTKEYTSARLLDLANQVRDMPDCRDPICLDCDAWLSGPGAGFLSD